jgi:hypothetical protein
MITLHHSFSTRIFTKIQSDGLKSASPIWSSDRLEASRSWTPRASREDQARKTPAPSTSPYQVHHHAR